MQLKQLKLAGFKSFVDPTTIPFPGQLVSVVGPNGCGKSNVIDAVRWVMGESSAKNLRGESMADVIFNGSSTRKAVGQASVELIFDNSMGRLSGQYASFQEISVKRVVTRDGDSSYLLNGVRCRRRDITDIFLGTGAGARGYSIIGQGTISRLIEARPEELRVFLEEAAGVSKYKERRRETLNRITHTRDNLARVADIREELNNQLQKLERQAKTAERYQMLKSEERRCKADILVLKWQTNHEEQSLLEQALHLSQVEYEQFQAEVTHAQRQNVHLREQHQEENTHLQNVQEQFYQLATEIALLEENRQQQQREKLRLLNEQQQIQSDWQTQDSQYQQDLQTQQASESRLAQIQTNLTLLEEELQQKRQVFQDVSQQKNVWQEQVEETQSRLADASRDEQVAQVSLNHLRQARQDCMLRLEKIEDEARQVEAALEQSGPDAQYAALALLQEEVAQEEQDSQYLNEHGEDLRTRLAEIENDWNRQQDYVRQLSVEHASLNASLQAAMSEGESSAATDDTWSQYPRLIELMTVEPSWQTACEWVLGSSLRAGVSDSMDNLWPELEAMKGAARNIITSKSLRAGGAKYPRLSDKIQGVLPHGTLSLDKIYTAGSLQEARDWLPQLEDDESVITEDGCWMGPGWLRMPGMANQDGRSLLARQQDLIVLGQTLSEVEAGLVLLKQQRDSLREELEQHRDKTAQAQQRLSLCREKTRVCEAEIREQERIAQQHINARARLTEERDDLLIRLEEMHIQQLEVESALQTATALRQQYEEKKNQIWVEKAHWDDELITARRQLDEAQQARHQCELAREREQLVINQLSKSLVRDQLRLEHMSERMEDIAEQLLALDTPDSTLADNLQDRLEQHQELEQQLALCRDKLGELSLDLERQEAKIREEEKRVRLIQDRIQEQQLQRQSLLVNGENLLASLHEMNVEPDTVLAALPSEITATIREEQLSDLQEKIRRLGAINLAAIEEYETEGQRKRFLDEQYEDLMEALQTLESAIEKMDRETTQRLQQTFDEVNAAFQALFPRLFGGGNARLELTGDNMLDAGVVVMAQPPGKRNSTIHLLSGGEKAMTAVALVFAIFQLNPSPFCMLDEVDAPLDDVNVGRFCTLVKEMSQSVQFLFITHNKIAMEMAEQLIGVTMKEPGVSRIVAVDVEQALAMTGLS
ncbi:chromosome segregation protein SMC [Legionella sp. CNM-4043-24]|uniref:chromosome segregation protein SMC n=1 Tax=Legionella sp. CNM-4043-24 TaxID=3421646 RepID=UPI00403AE98B